MKPDLFYILDGHSLIHAAFHAKMHPLSGPVGSCEDCVDDSCKTCGGTGREPTKATYVFLQKLVRICREFRPSYLVCCNDHKRESLRRRKICPDYKAQRGTSDPALTVQMKRIRQLLKLLGVPAFEVEGYEADDLIGTLTKKCVSDAVHIRVVSRDKDLGVLLEDPRVLMYDAIEDSHRGPEWIEKRFGVQPSQLTDYLTLVGDSVDGIKGCKGIGPKAALELLKEGSVNDYLRNHRHAKITKGWQKKFWAACDDGSLALARQLVPLDCGVPIKLKPGQLEFNGLNFKAAAPVLRSLAINPSQWS
jgi:DNA polymerase-1